MPNKDPKSALDSVIKKSRVHFYKPIQIAEVLYHHRTQGGFELSDVESYRNISKKWRDVVSTRLIGRVSTSSQKFQDNLFEDNAMPPQLLTALGSYNEKHSGVVEAYVYKSMLAKLASVHGVGEYIRNSTADTFYVTELVSMFTQSAGLRRSVDKIYEIIVYALFSTIVRALKAQITLEVLNEDKEILSDFEPFIKAVLGIDAVNTKLVLPASLYRVGVTNAADRGLDMWANFGAAVQVKHLTLTEELAEEIIDSITADRIVIVCLDAEKATIETVLKQVGWGERIQGIITLNDLDAWYKLCLSQKYRGELGSQLLKDLVREFVAEFPSSDEIKPFLQERGYDQLSLPEEWGVL